MVYSYVFLYFANIWIISYNTKLFSFFIIYFNILWRSSNYSAPHIIAAVLVRICNPALVRICNPHA